MENNNISLIFRFNNEKEELIFNLKDNYQTFLIKFNKIMNKHIQYRNPYYYEIIERKSSDETLEDLLKRGKIKVNYDYLIGGEVFSNEEELYNFFKILSSDDNGLLISPSIGYEGGGCPFEFVDFYNGKTKTLKFSKNAPEWRRVQDGLNLFGKCIYKQCEAYNKEVVDPKSNNIKFSIDEEKRNIKCPICGKNFMPLTFGFWKCEYQIKGVRLKNGGYEDVNINGKETNGDDFEYYDPSDNGTSYWDSLTIFVCARQKLKYKVKN